MFADGRFAYRRLSDERRARADRTTVQYWAGGMFGRGALQPDGEPYPSMDTRGLRPVQPPILPEQPPEGPLVLVSPGPTVPQEEGPNLTAFQDKEQNRFYKRFVRDYMRYQDTIQCAAHRVLKKIRSMNQRNGGAER